MRAKTGKNEPPKIGKLPFFAQIRHFSIFWRCNFAKYGEKWPYFGLFMALNWRFSLIFATFPKASRPRASRICNREAPSNFRFFDKILKVCYTSRPLLKVGFPCPLWGLPEAVLPVANIRLYVPFIRPYTPFKQA